MTTSACILLEAVCKEILDTLQVGYDSTERLTKLDRSTANAPDLAPEQYEKELFRQVIGGCHRAGGRTSLRDKLSASHDVPGASSALRVTPPFA